MVASLTQLQQALSQLRQRGGTLAQRLAIAYGAYLEVLAQSAPQQIIQVCFNLCTERQPAEFLALTVPQRQALQQGIQRRCADCRTKILQAKEALIPWSTVASLDPTKCWEEFMDLEEGLTGTLRETSFAMNQLLEEHRIIVTKSLETLFEIAAKAEESGRSITNPPLLLKAIVDTQEDSDHHPLTALYVQMGDLEFLDPKLMAARQTVRDVLQDLSQLVMNYEQKRDEYQVAEAIAAWRNSWFPCPADPG
jgi:hypothetical protein